MTCTCRPGTFDDGWHEVRGADCSAADRAQWNDAVTRWRATLDSIREPGISFHESWDRWSKAQQVEREMAIYDYLGMERAR